MDNNAKKFIVTLVITEILILVFLSLLLDGGVAVTLYIPSFVAHMIAIMFVMNNVPGKLSKIDIFIIKYGLVVMLMVTILIYRIFF